MSLAHSPLRRPGGIVRYPMRSAPIPNTWAAVCITPRGEQCYVALTDQFGHADVARNGTVSQWNGSRTLVRADWPAWARTFNVPEYLDPCYVSILSPEGADVTEAPAQTYLGALQGFLMNGAARATWNLKEAVGLTGQKQLTVILRGKWNALGATEVFADLSNSGDPTTHLAIRKPNSNTVSALPVLAGVNQTPANSGHDFDTDGGINSLGVMAFQLAIGGGNAVYSLRSYFNGVEKVGGNVTIADSLFPDGLNRFTLGANVDASSFSTGLACYAYVLADTLTSDQWTALKASSADPYLFQRARSALLGLPFVSPFGLRDRASGDSYVAHTGTVALGAGSDSSPVDCALWGPWVEFDYTDEAQAGFVPQSDGLYRVHGTSAEDELTFKWSDDGTNADPATDQRIVAPDLIVGAGLQLSVVSDGEDGTIWLSPLLGEI